MTKVKFYGYELTIDETTGLVTGETFKLRDTFKNIWKCKWDATNKGWILDASDIKRFLNSNNVTIINNEKIETVAPKTVKVNKVCPRCGTYCYGDCKSK